MAFDVVGVGASCVDRVCRLPVFPEAGGAHSKVRMHSLSSACGGQTATALATCTRLGLRTAYVGVVGDDDDGRFIVAELTKRGIAVDHVARLASPTPTATILIDPTGDRIVLWYRDPASVYPLDTLPRDLIAAARVVHVDDVDEAAALEAARCGRAAGATVTCDIDHVTATTEALLRQVTVPVLAEHVTLELTGETDHERALRRLRTWHPGLLIVTLGERGALALDGDRLIRVPAFRVNAVDTTGAGDVFRGGLIVGLLKGWPIGETLRFASAAAAASCTRAGAMGGVPGPADVEALLTAATPPA